MQKKLIAVAVAGALGVPAVAFAQTSTVTISGRMYMEYGYVNAGPDNAGGNRVNVDLLQTPGANISFQGEEKLGGNLSAWFKCESTADIRGQNQDGFCSRNSAVGFKGGFGNVFFGNWDTPFKRVMDAVGGGDTGFWGTAKLIAGHSTTVADGGSAGVFRRRQNNSINYDSPNFSGFQVMASTTSVNSASGRTQSAPNDKPRVWSVAGKYANGPLNIYGGYERHNDFYSAGVFAGDESGYVVGGSYTFAGRVKVGGLYTRQKWNTAAATDGKVRAWHLGVDWKLGGPHTIRAAYTNAGDVKGNAGALAVRPAAGVDSGAYMIQARYTYAFSKRTDISFGVNRLKNDTNAGYRIYGPDGGAAGPGAKHTAYGMAIDHRF